MNTDHDPPPLPADVIAAIREGRKIEAIKRLREHRGLGLEDAKDTVEAYMRYGATPSGGVDDPLPADVVHAIRDGRKVEAIKRLRAHRRIGLKEAKDAVEAYMRREPPLPAPIEPHAESGLGLSLLVFVFFVLGFLAYFFLSD
jgi:ribosomal protein L7/L12